MLTAPVATVFLFFFFLFLSFFLFLHRLGFFSLPKNCFIRKHRPRFSFNRSDVYLGPAWVGLLMVLFSSFFLSFFCFLCLLGSYFMIMLVKNLGACPFHAEEEKRKKKKTLVMSRYQECCICVCKRKREKRALSPENDTKTSPNFYLFIFWASCFRLFEEGRPANSISLFNFVLSDRLACSTIQVSEGRTRWDPRQTRYGWGGGGGGCFLVLGKSHQVSDRAVVRL